jgi:hypothetical protein
VLVFRALQAPHERHERVAGALRGDEAEDHRGMSPHPPLAERGAFLPEALRAAKLLERAHHLLAAPRALVDRVARRAVLVARQEVDQFRDRER